MANMPRRQLLSCAIRQASRNFSTHNCLIIMVKEPRLGRVKTRLAREVGAVEATRFYRTVTATIIRHLARDTRWRTVLAVTPDAAVDSAAWPTNIRRMAQAGGDIGSRMTRALAWNRAGRSVLIGSDIPGVRATYIAAVFRLLTVKDVVFGPADDGGFWLVGVRRPRDVNNLFVNVRWSTPDALADTLANLAGRRVGWATRLTDVDDAASLRATREKLGVGTRRHHR